MADRFLTRSELETLTGRQRPAAQRRVLDRQGIVFYLRPDGRPVVPISAIGPGAPPPAPIEPNWDALIQSSF